MQPEYTAKKSKWSAVRPTTFLLFFLIVPLFTFAFRLLEADAYSIKFYKDKIIVEKGFFTTTKKQMVFMGVTSVSTTQGLFGQMFNYGDVIVDCVGKWDVDTKCIKDPAKLEAYLQKRIVNGPASQQFVQM